MLSLRISPRVSMLASVAGILLLHGCSLLVDPDSMLLGGGPVGGPDAGPAEAGVPDAVVVEASVVDARVEDSRVMPPDAVITGPAIYDPANAGEGIWNFEAPDVRLSEGTFLFDTSTCRAEMALAEVREQSDGQEFCVIWAGDFLIEEGAELRVSGELPLAVFAVGEIQIAGTFDVSARAAEPGPGGYGGGPLSERIEGFGPGAGEGGEHEGTYDDGGGGGGGFCGRGGRGGNGGSASGGDGGRDVRTEGLEPLFGGSGGGRGRGRFGGEGYSNAGPGGAGGGAAQFSALGSLRVTGRILAGGGGGGAGSDRVRSTNWGSGGGGGSGGALLLQAPVVVLASTGSVNVAGGGGGGSASRMGEGENGQDGADTFEEPRGGAPGDSQYGANGGDGAGGDRTSGGMGRSNETGGANGGGGGGGAGCIVVRTDDAEVGGGFQVNPRVEEIVDRLPLE